MNRKFLAYRIHSIFLITLPFLGACSLAGQIAKDSVEEATSSYSKEHFTLTITLPAKFGFTSKAKYLPKDGGSCTTYNPSLGASVSRQQQKSNTTEAKDTEQTVSTDIPLQYSIAGCAMTLVRVSYEVSAAYGADAWSNDLELAGGTAIKSEVAGDANTPYPDVIEQRGLCAWSFQISTAKAKKNQIEKILTCAAANSNWEVPSDRFQRRKPGGAVFGADIVNKTIHATFKLSTEETPYYQRYWFKVPNGWKPCTGRWNSDREELCTTPPQFRTFIQNGRECSVYPGCDK
ncbi:hypothetical protein [Pseudomonas sp. HS6]|uniref:hypothetical protein n=1 Tax=Pseudomonas sp. HS6 TaxID=2850559 RepID=UPI0020190E88|nr:hypothetical protein [Pseudomonas sp. HS6]UQS16439.1 hypothetical protein JJN09_06130 [Pseudomonas sp. HS6]